MLISGFSKESYIDYPGKVSSIVFTPSCNFRCPGCHAKYVFENKERIPEEEIFEYLDSKKNWVEAVVITGGEPTLEINLLDFMKKVKQRGMLVKLDTNGSNPELLENLVREGVIDYVAMDIKSPPDLYSNTIGREIDIQKIEESMKLCTQFPDYEFRTTVVPIRRSNGEISFLTSEEGGEMAKWIVETTGKNDHKYFLQRFVPRGGSLLDSELESFPETSDDLLKEMQKEIIGKLPKSRIR